MDIKDMRTYQEFERATRDALDMNAAFGTLCSTTVFEWRRTMVAAITIRIDELKQFVDDSASDYRNIAVANLENVRAALEALDIVEQETFRS